jgi:glycosyltransferase 2 family protein
MALVERGGTVQDPSVVKRFQPWAIRAIGILLLVYLLSQVDLGELAKAWGRADKPSLLLAVVLAFLMMVVKIWRWQNLLLVQKIKIPFHVALSAYFSTYYAGIITPGRAGEFLKVLYVRHKTSTSFASAMVSVLLDRLLDIMVLLGLAALGVAIVPQFSFLNQLWFWTGGLGLVAVGFLLILRLRLVQRVTERLLGSTRKYTDPYSPPEQLEDFTNGLQMSLRPQPLLIAGVLTLVSWICLLCACYCMAFSLGIQASFTFIAFAMAIAGLLSLLPVSIAGIGVRDGTLAAIFGLAGISVQASLAYSLMYFSVFSILLGLVGAYYWYRYPLQSRIDTQSETW